MTQAAFTSYRHDRTGMAKVVYGTCTYEQAIVRVGFGCTELKSGGTAQHRLSQTFVKPDQT
jgi:hypothetical protein